MAVSRIDDGVKGRMRTGTAGTAGMPARATGAARRLTAGALALAFLTAGCAGSHEIRGEDLDGFQGSVAEGFIGRRVTVRTAGGETEGTLTAVRETPDVLEVRRPGEVLSDGELVTVPLDEVESLEFSNDGSKRTVVAVTIVGVGAALLVVTALASNP